MATPHTLPKTLKQPDHVVIFDGVCNLCNGLVKFIIKRDSRCQVYFSAMQSDYAQALMANYQIDQLAMDTFVFVTNDEIYIRSSAALELAKHLDGLWPALRLFTIVPLPIRDIIYRLVARNRYRWFGKRDSCMVPDKAQRARFIVDTTA